MDSAFVDDRVSADLLWVEKSHSTGTGVPMVAGRESLMPSVRLLGNSRV